MPKDYTNDQRRLVGFGRERLRHLIAGLFVWVAVSCDSPGNAPPPIRVGLDSVGSSAPLPTSLNMGFAAASNGTACAFDSYERQLVCANSTGGAPRRWGRAGAGPGEFGEYGILISRPRGGVGFVDLRYHRVTFYSDSGYIGQQIVEGPFTPITEVLEDGRILGHRMPNPATPARLAIAELNHDGELAHPEELNLRSAPLADSTIATGAVKLAGGGVLVRLEGNGRSALLHFAAGSSAGRLLENPSSKVALPTERDVEVYVEQYRSLLRSPPPASMIEDYRQKPLGWIPRGTMHRLAQEDAQGRIWVLTSRRSGGSTELDVFRNTTHDGIVHLAGRVVGIQVVGDLLVTLVDLPSDADGIAARRFVWYRIGGS